MTAPDPQERDVQAFRVSSAERNEAVERLNVAFSEGRLTLDEFSTRVDQVFASTTDVELNGTLAGLPEPAPAPIPVSRSNGRDLFRRRANHIVRGATPAIVCTAVWAMTGHGYFWPEWVWLGTGANTLRELRPRHRNHDAQQAIERGNGTLGTADVTPEVRRMVLTAVFMDIVGSTEKATALGDRAWGEVVRRFEQLVGRELEAHKGRKLFSKGDEIVATFRSPADSIRYACAVRDAIRPLQIELRVGIHTGEVEGRHRDLRGIALHIGQRVSVAAGPGEILVSSTVRDLARGSGIEFVDRGDHELRGLPDTWRLYAVEPGAGPS